MLFRSEQHVVGLHRPILGGDRRALDQRQQVALHALAADRATAHVRNRDLVDLVEEDDAVGFGIGQRNPGDIILVHALFGFLVDQLTAMMMVVVSSVSLCVHVYTMGYMEDDDGYQRFFSYISLFTFSMMMLVMSNNFLQLFFGWEAVGLVSYLLIGFWYTRPTAIFANMKAFLVNRVGDFGFALGIGMIVYQIGRAHV